MCPEIRAMGVAVIVVTAVSTLLRSWEPLQPYFVVLFVFSFFFNKID